MYNWSCFNDIRILEAALYEGHETADKIFEREESYQAPHEDRRSLRDSLSFQPEKNGDSNAWYRIEIIPDENKVIRHFIEDEGECEN